MDVFKISYLHQSKKLLLEVQKAVRASEEKAAKTRSIYAQKSALLAAAMEEFRAAREAFETMQNQLLGEINQLKPKLKFSQVFLLFLLSAPHFS